MLALIGGLMVGISYLLFTINQSLRDAVSATEELQGAVRWNERIDTIAEKATSIERQLGALSDLLHALEETRSRVGSISSQIESLEMEVRSAAINLASINTNTKQR